MTTRQNDPEKEMSMTGDYLWDGSGAPDAEIQHLETILVEFRHAERPLVLPVTHNPVAIMKPRGVLQSPWLSRCAAAVMLIALSLGIFFSRRASYNAPGIGPSWNVANLDGNPQIGSQSVWANQTTAKLYVGQTLTTNSSSRATLSEVDLGQIQIDPNSRVRLLRTDLNHKRLQLEVGTIHAAIWAPPGQFVVDTPSAVAIDLGCAYTLQVAPDGSGTIRTTIGWVGFHLNGRDSFIPAGAMCSTRPKVGPGVPYFEDASESLRNALHTFDQAESSSNAASSALSTILSQARPRDGLTLWHLLSRTGGSERAQVYTRFAALVPPPPGVTREGILALDPHMLDLYWNALDLGDISLWRFWEESSDHHATPTPQQILMKKATLLKKTQ
jgi:FecR protein